MLTTTVSLVIALILWARVDDGAHKQGFLPASRGHSRAVAFLIFVALLVVLNPEVRLLLLFIDAVGIDVFFLLVLFQVQGGITWVRRAGLPMLWRVLRDWGPLPFSVPTSALLRKHPVLGVCFISAPVVALGFVGAAVFLCYVTAMTLVAIYA